MSAVNDLFEPIFDALEFEASGRPECPPKALNAVLARIRAVEGSLRQREIVECALGGVLLFEAVGARSTATRLLSGLQLIRDEITEQEKAAAARRGAFVAPKPPPKDAVPVSSLATKILAGRRIC